MEVENLWDTVVEVLLGVGDPVRYVYDEPIIIIPECDGLRILSNTSREFLHREPDSTVPIFQIESTLPAALLYDDLDHFDRRSAKADENLRLIRSSLPEAVEACIVTVGYGGHFMVLNAKEYEKLRRSLVRYQCLIPVMRLNINVVHVELMSNDDTLKEHMNLAARNHMCRFLLERWCYIFYHGEELLNNFYFDELRNFWGLASHKRRIKLEKQTLSFIVVENYYKAIFLDYGVAHGEGVVPITQNFYFEFMATGKAPWNQQYQEVAALFYVGTTKSHPPIPDYLSVKARDSLLKCLQKEAHLRSTASELIKHLFVTGECRKPNRSSLMDDSPKQMKTLEVDIKHSTNLETRASSGNGLKDVCKLSGFSYSPMGTEQFPEGGSLWKPANDDDDDMCLIDENDDLVLGKSMKLSSTLFSSNLDQNPLSEPNCDWTHKLEDNPELNERGKEFLPYQINETGNRSLVYGDVDYAFSFTEGQLGPEDDDEVTESKIKEFLEEKAVKLKRLQTLLYQLYNSLNVAAPSSPVGAFVPTKMKETAEAYLGKLDLMVVYFIIIWDPGGSYGACDRGFGSLDNLSRRRQIERSGR